MRVASLALVSAVTDAVDNLQDDASLLSIRANNALASSSRELSANLMDAVGNRNVTQMAAMMQTLAEETIQGDGIVLDKDIQSALDMIKNTLLGNIRAALNNEHTVDQTVLDQTQDCFQKCEHDRHDHSSELENFENSATTLKASHNDCRQHVQDLYISKIEACRDLDEWMSKLVLPALQKEECLDPEQSKMQSFFTDVKTWVETNEPVWKTMNQKCTSATQEYLEADQECDETQGDWEAAACALVTAQWSGCNVEYTGCRASCITTFHTEVKRVECAERDRKIDWSATEKIACYLDVLLMSPTDAQLKENCEEGQNCLQRLRETKFHECEQVCEEIDYDNPLDEYRVVDEVNTTHRADDASVEKRCTRHLDINFPSIPCEHQCDPLPTVPCEDDFIEEHYTEFDKTTPVQQVASRPKCHEQEHKTDWAYNRATCIACPALTGKQHVSENPHYCERLPEPVVQAQLQVNGQEYDLVNYADEAKLWNDRDYTLRCSKEMQDALFWLQPHKAISSGAAHIKNLPLGSRVYVAMEGTGNGRHGGITFSDSWVDMGQACSWHGYGNNAYQFDVRAMSITTEEDRHFALQISSSWVGFVAYKVDQPVIGLTHVEAKFSHCADQVIQNIGDENEVLDCKVNEFSCGGGKHQSDHGQCQVRTTDGKHEVRACFVDRCWAKNAWKCGDWGETSSIDSWMDVTCKVTTPTKSLTPSSFKGECQHDEGWHYVLDYHDRLNVDDIPNEQSTIAAGFAHDHAYFIGNAAVDQMDIDKIQICHLSASRSCAGKCSYVYNKHSPSEVIGNHKFGELVNNGHNELKTDAAKIIAAWSGQALGTGAMVEQFGSPRDGDQSWNCNPDGSSATTSIQAGHSGPGWHVHNWGLTLSIRQQGLPGRTVAYEFGWYNDQQGSRTKNAYPNDWATKCGPNVDEENVFQIRVHTSHDD